MEFGEYAAARRGRLLERARAAGLDEDAAASLVDGLLFRHARLIRRRVDPHPEIERALVGALRRTGVAVADDERPATARGRSALRTGRSVLVALGTVAALAAVVVLQREPAPVPVPGVFGRDAADAAATLREAGFVPDERVVPACLPTGRVVSTQPGAGTRLGAGATVTVSVAAPADVFCMARYPDLLAAWELLDFMAGRGPAPPFASSVLVVRGDRRRVLPGPSAAERSSWADSDDVWTAVGEALASPAPALAVGRAVAAEDPCGAERAPADPTARTNLTIVVSQGRDRCGLTIRLHRRGHRIDAVVLPAGQR